MNTPPKSKSVYPGQRGDECFLASICHLHGYDYLYMSREFKRRYGMTWSQAIDVDIELWYKFLESYGHRYRWREHPIQGRPTSNMTGILVFRRDYGAHAVAYVDGIIYDSGIDKYGTIDSLSEWWGRYVPVAFVPMETTLDIPERV